MKNISAKIRLTLFTTFLMLLMASILIGLMFSLSDDIVLANSIDVLTEVVDDNYKELEFDDGKLDTDDIDFFKKGVYTLLYTQDGEHITGDFPKEGISTQPFMDKEATEFTLDGTLYYIYDRLTPVEDSRLLVWVRGIIAVDELASATNSILQTALFSLPLFVLIGAIGCYFIAKSTFRPIDKITKTAEEISKSENLALRINLQQASPEIRKLSNTFDKMFERLESVFEVEKQFTSDVSHELRTPTAVILAQCEYAMGENITIEEKEEALETVQRQATRMSKLISELLTLIRMDRDFKPAGFKQVNISELVRDVCEEHKLIDPVGLKMTYDIASNINVELDEAMITRLLENLISNSISYKKENSNANVHVTLAQTDTEIILSVKDDGIGIAKEHMEKIWQRFYRVDKSRASSQHGNMGLGLSMVAQIAKIHNAKIELESELNNGSLFTVKFTKKIHSFNVTLILSV